MSAVVLAPAIVVALGEAPVLVVAVDIVHPDLAIAGRVFIVGPAIGGEGGRSACVVPAPQLFTYHGGISYTERIVADSSPLATVQHLEKAHAVVTARVQTNRIHRRERLHLNDLKISVPIQVEEVSALGRQQLTINNGS